MLLMMIVVVVEVKARRSRVAREPGARLLVGRVAESHVPFAQPRSPRPVRQGGGRLGGWRLGLRLLLLGRVMVGGRLLLLLILLVLGVLDRRRCHRLVNRDPTPLLVQGATMEVAFADSATVRAVHGAPVPRHGLVDVVRTLGRVDVDGGAVERVGSLLHQAARDPVGLGLGLGLQLRLLLLSLPRRVLMVCLDRRFEDILEGYATACVNANRLYVDFFFFFFFLRLSFALRSN